MEWGSSSLEEIQKGRIEAYHSAKQICLEQNCDKNMLKWIMILKRLTRVNVAVLVEGGVEAKLAMRTLREGIGKIRHNISSWTDGAQERHLLRELSLWIKCYGGGGSEGGRVEWERNWGYFRCHFSSSTQRWRPSVSPQCQRFDYIINSTWNIA